MKHSGIVRKVDDLGRIVLPMELRKTLFISQKDSLEIYTHEDTIVLRKYEPGDIFSGEYEDLIEYKGKKVSRKSILDMCKVAGIKVSGTATKNK